MPFLFTEEKVFVLGVTLRSMTVARTSHMRAKAVDMLEKYMGRSLVLSCMMQRRGLVVICFLL